MKPWVRIVLDKVVLLAQIALEIIRITKHSRR